MKTILLSLFISANFFGGFQEGKNKGTEQKNNPNQEVYTCTTGKVYHKKKDCKALTSCSSGTNTTTMTKARFEKRSACGTCSK